MPVELFENMKTAVGFSQADADALRDLAGPISPFLGPITDQFYENLRRDPRTSAILESGEQQLESLRGTLLTWLEELFCGRYDEAFFERCCNIGRTHVRVNLPPPYMFTAMNLIRLALVERINQLDIPDPHRKIAALHKILDLELAIMNETYREDLIEHMKEIERAQYRQQLSESEHLATVGQLAASLAHEIKNPLAGISGAIQVLGAGLDADHPHKEIITEVLHQIDRLDMAVKDLLIYARPKPPERKRIDLSNTLNRTLILLQEEPVFRNVHVVCEGLEESHVVEADEAQIQQVFTNLMLNAAHACKQGGHVRCTIEHANSSIRVTTEDDGAGMEQSVLARVFEPFYTTKARGTGLGLPICKRIVEAHDGRIDIRSTPGEGTFVTFDIPEQK
jgi:signal transduction histidine kinase